MTIYSKSNYGNSLLFHVRPKGPTGPELTRNITRTLSINHITITFRTSAPTPTCPQSTPQPSAALPPTSGTPSLLTSQTVTLSPSLNPAETQLFNTCHFHCNFSAANIHFVNNVDV